MTSGKRIPRVTTSDDFFEAVGDDELAHTIRHDIAGNQRGSTPMPDGCDDYPPAYWSWLIAEYDLWRDNRSDTAEHAAVYWSMDR